MAKYVLRGRTRDGQPIVQLKCPRCGEWADLDDDQLHGRVSTHHDDPDCGYHETVDFASLAEWDPQNQEGYFRIEGTGSDTKEAG